MCKFDHLFYTLFHGFRILLEQNSTIKFIRFLNSFLLFFVILNIVDFYQRLMPQMESFLQVLGNFLIVDGISSKHHLFNPVGYNQSIALLFYYSQHLALAPALILCIHIVSYQLILLTLNQTIFELTLKASLLSYKQNLHILIWSNQIQFKYSFVKMVGQELTKLQSKISSTQVLITTTQSKHQKQKNWWSFEQQGNTVIKQLIEKNALNDCQGSQFNKQKVDDWSQNRLFTFMDERDRQKKVIQNFIFKQPSKHHYQSYSPHQNNSLLLNVANLQTQRKEENERKKRQIFLNKLFQVNIVNKPSKSISQLNKINQLKTPKALPQSQSKYQTIECKNKSKTPKLNENRSVTPKYEKAQKLFRAKSSLQKGLITKGIFQRVTNVKGRSIKKQNEDQQEAFCYMSKKQSIKSLVKKKKQLETELMVINKTLVTRKKNTSAANSKKCSKISNKKVLKSKK